MVALLPELVQFRKKAPVVFDGMVKREPFKGCWGEVVFFSNMTTILLEPVFRLMGLEPPARKIPWVKGLGVVKVDHSYMASASAL